MTNNDGKGVQGELAELLLCVDLNVDRIEWEDTTLQPGFFTRVNKEGDSQRKKERQEIIGDQITNREVPTFKIIRDQITNREMPTYKIIGDQITNREMPPYKIRGRE